MKSILALDIGTQTGWAVNMKPNSKIISGSISFKPSRFEGGGMRFLKFEKFLNELKTSADFDVVFYEAVRRHAGTDAAHIYGGFLGHLTSWCETRKIPYQSVPVGTIKKHATGKGNASKNEMIHSAQAKGFSPSDDNEADALAILCYSIEYFVE